MDVNNQMMFGVAVVLASVVISTIISVIMRLLNSNERTLKHIQDVRKSYRDEVAATSNRIREESLQAVARVEKVCQEGTEMVSSVADALDNIATYQQDLNALSNTCISYHNSLEKLRQATEQVEARIQAVQEEVRKVESVSEFVKRAEADFSRLSSQLQGTRAEYVKLVAATEQELRSKAEAQKNENQDMLQSFVVELEGYRSSLASFTAKERSDFSTFAEEELEKAKASADQMEDRRQQVEEQISGMQALLHDKQEELEQGLESLTEKSDDIKEQAEHAQQSVQDLVKEERQALQDAVAELDKNRSTLLASFGDSISEKLAEADSDLDARSLTFSEEAKDLQDKANSALDTVKGSIQSSLSGFEEDFNGLKDKFAASMGEQLKKASDSLEAGLSKTRSEHEKLALAAETAVKERETRIGSILKETMAKLQAEEDSVKALLDEATAKAGKLSDLATSAAVEATGNVTAARDTLDKSLSGFSSSASALLAKAFESMDTGLDRRWKKLQDSMNSMVAAMNSSVTNTKETITQLYDGESDRIRETVEKLSELEEKIKASDDQLIRITQEVTSAREELYNAQQEKQRMERQQDELSRELKTLQLSVSAQKEEKIKSEAALLRLKSEVKSLQKTRDQAKPKPEKEKKFASMIEEFPDELLTGETVEIDLSDDV